jgi:hypothetical protein
VDLEPTPAMRTRRFEFIRKNGLWTINGKRWGDVEKSGHEYVWADPSLGDT